MTQNVKKLSLKDKFKSVMPTSFDIAKWSMIGGAFFSAGMSLLGLVGGAAAPGTVFSATGAAIMGAVVGGSIGIAFSLSVAVPVLAVSLVAEAGLRHKFWRTSAAQKKPVKKAAGVALKTTKASA